MVEEKPTKKERPVYVGVLRDKDKNVIGYLSIWRNKNFVEVQEK